MNLSLWNRSTHSGKEKVSGETVSKGGHADNFVGHERTHDY